MIRCAEASDAATTQYAMMSSSETSALGGLDVSDGHEDRDDLFIRTSRYAVTSPIWNMTTRATTRASVPSIEMV